MEHNDPLYTFTHVVETVRYGWIIGLKCFKELEIHVMRFFRDDGWTPPTMLVTGKSEWCAPQQMEILKGAIDRALTYYNQLEKEPMYDGPRRADDRKAADLEDRIS